MEHHIINDEGEEAIIYLPVDEIDMETLKQIKAMNQHPATAHVRVMPDAHKGSGCCVGLTSHLLDKIKPNFVGGDIGCGILTYPLNDIINKRKNHRKVANQMDNRIRNAIPLGQEVHDAPIISDEELEAICDSAASAAEEFAYAYENKFGIDITAYIPEYSNEWLKKYCQLIKIDYTYVLRSLGSLGGGNHFIEINLDSQQNAWFTVHSGSRGFGKAVCAFHQEKINSTRKFDWEYFNTTIAELQEIIDDSNVLKQKETELRAQMYKNKRPDYLTGEEAYEYFFDMIFAQKYAQLNRRLMVKEFLASFNIPFVETKLTESIHNYIDFKDFVMRKGSISAHKGEICLVALNMKDGVLLCRGKGNPEWNFSSAHGSGRIINRGTASQSLDLKQFKLEMQNVYSTSVCQETLDESPMAYRNSELIKQALEPSVEIIDQLIPFLNVKALT